MSYVDQARRVIASNDFMVLATADAEGSPWATPVFFSPFEDREFYWVSSPQARHSHNITVRPPHAGRPGVRDHPEVGGGDALGFAVVAPP